MRVVVLSAATGELVCDHTDTLFWQMRGWEFRGWLCKAICCAQYFSLILLVQQLLLCDMACIGEYAEGEVLTPFATHSGITCLGGGQAPPNIQVVSDTCNKRNPFVNICQVSTP